MTTHRPSRLIAGILIMINTLALSAGCSGERDADADAAASAPQVDPRYATPEALLAEFNAMTTKEPVNVTGMLGLIFAENTRQRELLQITNIMVPAYGLNDAMQKRFKQPLDPNQPRAFAATVNGPAAITSSEGERATATYVESDGRTETLQLVRYNGRWWISGYTLERQPVMKDATNDDLLYALVTMRQLAAASPAMTTRIESGEFKNANEARQALQAALTQLMLQNPADQQIIRDLAQRNPKYAAMFKASSGGAQR